MSANERQVGGDHYSKAGKDEQHWDRVARLGLDYFQAQITKYVERCWDKNGVEDLHKAAHFLQKYIELNANRLSSKQQMDFYNSEAEVQAREALENELAALRATSTVEAVLDLNAKLEFVLKHYVISEDGQFTFPDGDTFDCLRGHPLNPALDFSMEGAYGDGRIMWKCLKCNTKVFTTGSKRPHAAHRCDDAAAEPQPHGYVDQDGDLAAGPHTVVLPPPA